MKKRILSLFDHSGEWSKPYRDAGYEVVQVDIKNGIDILGWDYKVYDKVHGILAAPPCTDFALSGSRYFAKKDADADDGHRGSLQAQVLGCRKPNEPNP
jgi:site-specific DNA-cytosine methylase